MGIASLNPSYDHHLEACEEGVLGGCFRLDGRQKFPMSNLLLRPHPRSITLPTNGTFGPGDRRA
jgi:hypothetical protein